MSVIDKIIRFNGVKNIKNIYLEKNLLIEDLNRWVNGDKVKYLDGLDDVFKEIEPLLDNRFIKMENNLCFDKDNMVCWVHLCNDKFILPIDNHKNISLLSKINGYYYQITMALQKIFNKKIITPTAEEIKSIEYINYSSKKDINQAYINYISDFNYLPSYIRIYKNIELSKREIFILFLANKLKPIEIDNKYYNILLKTNFVLDNLKIINISKNIFSFKYIKINNINLIDDIRKVDKIRANLVQYKRKIFFEFTEGSWEAFSRLSKKQFKQPFKVTLNEPILAKNPRKSIIQGGVIGIDFGTKSTVVVYQKNDENISPIRVGIGDWNKAEKPYHFENPTVMEFINLEQFLDDYKKPIFRPYTKWNDLTISHTAYTNLQNSHSNQFNSYLTELKQWAGDKNRKLQIQDQQGDIYELKEFVNIEKDDINPIEIYAYYLGLYINNQHQDSIFLEYLLSFPITYEIEVREKIAQSFRRGIAKSLPNIGYRDNELKVISGVSEPASYASIALQEYGLAEENEKNFYGIFDFGGGTTDFDFGIFRWSDENNKKEKRFDYVIEHFGAGGDRYLGGENLLEMLAFEIFKKNRDTLRKQNISFEKPAECREFLGSELLLSDSREARLNLVSLASKLREFWEREEFGDESIYPDGLKVDLYDNSSQKIAKVELEIDEIELLEILKTRIAKGVEALFVGINKAFYSQQNEIEFDVDTINIFLAGNSSKSPIVKELFEKNIKELEDKFREANIEDASIEIYNPLENKNDFNKPNGKTGVAFGLIETRTGGRILVIDKNIKDDNISFKYYLGINKRRKFKVKIDREMEYNRWIEFIDASQDSFEIYYTSSPLANKNSLPITDNSIKKIRLNISKVDEDLSVFIKLINSTTFEYGVGSGVDDVEEIKVMEL